MEAELRVVGEWSGVLYFLGAWWEILSVLYRMVLEESKLFLLSLGIHWMVHSPSSRIHLTFHNFWLWLLYESSSGATQFGILRRLGYFDRMLILLGDVIKMVIVMKPVLHLVY